MRILALISCMLCAAMPARAHMVDGIATQSIHLFQNEESGNVQLLLRFPLTLAYLEAQAQRARPTDPFEAPYLTSTMVNGAAFFRPDEAALAADPGGFAVFLIRDIHLAAQGADVTLQVDRLALVAHDPGEIVGPSLQAGMALLDRNTQAPGDHFLADLDVVLLASLPGVTRATPVTLTFGATPVPLPPSIVFETRVTDHRSEPALFQGYATLYPPATNLPGAPADKTLWVIGALALVVGGITALWRPLRRHFQPGS